MILSKKAISGFITSPHMPDLNLFLSWSGDQSREVAKALKDWLPLVLGDAVVPWFSASDIAAGSRFISEIGRSLEGCGMGILCLTADNRDAPWIVFEAGALSKSLSDAFVIPYVLNFDLSELRGPLSQFQAKAANYEGTFAIVAQVNAALPTPTSETALKRRYDALWPHLETHIKRALATHTTDRLDGWWAYSLLAETPSGLRDTVGYFRIRQSSIPAVEDGRALWPRSGGFIHRGNWRSDRVWLRETAVHLIYSMTSVAPVEGLPTEYDGYMEMTRYSLTPVLGESTWVGSFNDLGHRALVRGPVYAERFSPLERVTGDDLKRSLADHQTSLLDRVREFWPEHADIT